MIHNRQKALLHIYKNAAALSEPSYRNILRDAAGVSSAADRRLSQVGFEAAMASLETTLFSRVDSGHVPNPLGRNRLIASRSYWRAKVRPTGMINSRQCHEIMQRWQQLCEFQEPEKSNTTYFHGIIARATGRREPCGPAALSNAEAGFVLNALSDCLALAIRQARADAPVQQEIPF